MSSTAVLPAARVLTAVDLVAMFGPIALHRICWNPLPGMATEQDVLDWHDHHDRLYELVDGVLVEKIMGLRESLLAGVLITVLRLFVVPRNLGLVTAPDGMMRLTSGNVRIPDVSFISWDHIPGRRVPDAPIPDLWPDLAIEVLSESNTDKEMTEKRRDYFGSGTRLVWQIDPETRTADAYTAPDVFVRIDASGTLDGGAVLPGFTLPLRDLFAELDRQG
jgi:Uma2 family endonuclease